VQDLSGRGHYLPLYKRKKALSKIKKDQKKFREKGARSWCPGRARRGVRCDFFKGRETATNRERDSQTCWREKKKSDAPEHRRSAIVFWKKKGSPEKNPASDKSVTAREGT